MFYNKTFYYYLFIFLFILFFSWRSNPDLRGHAIEDTESYIKVALHFTDENARDRPIGYPLFLRACMIIDNNNWQSIVVLIQMLLLALIACIIYNLYRSLNISSLISFSMAIFICISPGIIKYVSFILPEFLLGFFILLTFVQTINIDIRNQNNKPFIQAAIAGFLSGVALLLKPVWLFGIFSLAIGFFIYNIQNYKKAAVIILIMIISNVIIWWSWQFFLISNFGQFTISRVGSRNFNMVTLRAGLTKNATGTPLFEYLKEKGLLKQAEKLTWDNYDKFIEIKGDIPWEERADSSFYEKALSKDILPFIKLKIYQWPHFFKNKPEIITDKNFFPFTPNSLKITYFRIYRAIFSKMILILLLISMIIGLYVSRLRLITIINSLILLYLSTIITLLSYQEHHFTRMRVGLDPLILIMAFLPICILINNLLKRYWPRLMNL